MSSPAYKQYAKDGTNFFVPEELVKEKLAKARVCFFTLGTVFGGAVGPAAYSFARWLMGY